MRPLPSRPASPRHRAIRAILAVGALLASAASPALGQPLPPTEPADPPPPRQSFDSNSVNPALGQFSYSLGQLATGGGPDGALVFALAGTGSAGRDQISGYVQTVGSTYYVVFGNASESFTLSGSTFTSQQGSGSTLTLTGGDYYYTTRDGTVFRFDADFASDYPEAGIMGRVISATSPNGVVRTYHYRVASTLYDHDDDPETDPQIISLERVQSVTNNLGFQLHFQFAGNTIQLSESDATVGAISFRNFYRIIEATAINNAVDYCAPTTLGACPNMTQDWPSVAFEYVDNSQTFQVVSITATDNLDREVTMEFAGGSRVTRITRPEAGDEDVEIGYGTVGGSSRVTSFNDGAGAWSYSYQTSGSAITQATIDPPVGGNTVVAINTTHGLPSGVTNGVSETTSYLYDSLGRMTRTTLPEGNQVRLTYDARGNVTEVRRVAKAGTGIADIVSTATYPASCTDTGITPATCNQPIETTQIVGTDNRNTNWFYSADHGGVTRVRFPAPSLDAGSIRPQIDFTYSRLRARYRNSSGVIADAPSEVWRLVRVEQCITGNDCDGTTDETETVIDRRLNGVDPTNLLPLTIRRQAGDNSMGATTSYSYDPFANLQVVDGPLAGSGDTVHYRYSAGIQLQGMIGPDPDGATTTQHRRAQRYTYDDNGNVTRSDIGTVNGTSDTAWNAFAVSQSQVHGYDDVGRRINSTLHDSTTTGDPFARSTFSYDAGSRLTCSALRMTLTGSVPANACTLDTAGSFGPDRITQYSYDNADRVTSVTDGLGASEAATRWTRAFTDNGQVHTLADGEGNLTTYVHDGFDRLASRCYPNASGSGSSTTDCDEYDYNSTGTVDDWTQRDNGVVAYSYDRLDRLIAIEYPGTTPDVTFAYDDLNRMTQAVQPAITLDFTYDQLGRLLRESNSVLGAVTSTYRNDGVRTHIAYPDGASFEITRNQAGAPTHLFEGDVAANQPLGRWDYDTLNRVAIFTQGRNAEPGRVDTAIGYDPVSRLASLGIDLPSAASPGDVTIGLTAYNPASQIVTRTRSNAAYVFDDPVEGSTGYDPNGLNQYDALTGTGAATLDYDGRGNMTSYNPSGTANDRAYTYDARNLMVSATLAGGTTTNLSYDPLGRLYQVNAPGTADDRRYLWDGDTIIAEINPTTGAIRRRFVHAPGSLGAPIAQYEGATVSAASRRYLQTDERGSVISAVDSDDGTQSVANTYDPYGRPGAGNSGQFQYAGQLWLPETGTYYMRARMYDPALGRFLQTDPIGYAGGMNLCAYAGNDPINFIDPLGLTLAELFDWGVIVVVGDRCSAMFCTSFKFDRNESPRLDGGQGGGVGGGGGGGGEGDEKDSDEKPPCKPPLQEGGTIAFAGSGAELIPLIGLSGLAGDFVNLSTGTSGSFIMVGFSAGIGASAGVTIGQFESLASFAGFSESYTRGRGSGAYTEYYNLSGDQIGSSVTYSGGLPASLQGTFGETIISNVRQNPVTCER